MLIGKVEYWWDSTRRLSKGIESPLLGKYLEKNYF